MSNKDKLYFSHAIEIRKSSTHGYGVFATRDIVAKELLEECYCIMLSTEWKRVDDTLKDFVFAAAPFKLGNPSSVIALGHAMVYNHKEKYNVEYKYYSKESMMKFVANTDLSKDEELFVHYGRDSHSAVRLRAKLAANEAKEIVELANKNG